MRNTPARLGKKEPLSSKIVRKYGFELTLIVIALSFLLFVLFAYIFVGATESSMVYNHGFGSY